MLAASRNPNQRICVYFDSAETAKYVYNEVRTIKVGDEDVNIRPLRSLNTRVIISNVNPEITNEDLARVFSLMSITPVSRIATLKISYEDPEIAHMICWRRQVFIKPADVSKLAPIVAIQKKWCQIQCLLFHWQIDLINQLMATPIMPQENNRKKAPKRSNSSQASTTEAIQEKKDESDLQKHCKKKHKTSEQKITIKEMKEHVNKAVEKLPEKKLEINNNTVSQFLFDTYGKSDIEDILRNITCDLPKLDNALRDIRNLMPPNILARIRRLRTKISLHQNMDIDHSDDNLTQKKKDCA
ncbi:hypothetical protein TKK_0010196 [Trichogramma kaykai]